MGLERVQAAGRQRGRPSLSSASGGQRSSPLWKRPTGRSRRTVTAWSSRSTITAVFAVQVAARTLTVDPDGIADTELGDRIRGANGVQQRAACLDGVRERDDVLVEFAGGDRVKQQSLGSTRGLVADLGPEGCLRLFAGGSRHAQMMSPTSGRSACRGWSCNFSLWLAPGASLSSSRRSKIGPAARVAGPVSC